MGVTAVIHALSLQKSRLEFVQRSRVLPTDRLMSLGIMVGQLIISYITEI